MHRWLVFLALVGCTSSEASKTWKAVEPGTLDVAISSDGRFIGVDIAGGVLEPGADPWEAWKPVPELTQAFALGGFTTHRITTVVGGNNWVTAHGAWSDLGAVDPSAALLAVADDDAKIVQTPSGELRRVAPDASSESIYMPLPGEIVTPYISPRGAVYVPAARIGDALALLSPAGRTPIVDGLPCSADDPTCSRAIRLLGFDGRDRLYAVVFSAATPEGMPVYRYDGQWHALPTIEAGTVDGQVSCSITAAADAYCQADTDIGTKLFHLGDGGSGWADLGVMPSISACGMAAREDGRIALRCASLGNGRNSGLYVSD